MCQKCVKNACFSHPAIRNCYADVLGSVTYCCQQGMHLLCEDESVIGRAFYVMEFVEGRVLWDQALPGMTPTERGAIYDEMNRVIAALHGVDPARPWACRELWQAGQLLRAPDRRGGAAVPQASVTEPIAAMDRLIAWLPAAHPGRRTRPYCGVHRARRLPPRQPDLPPHRAARAGGARLGALDRSAIRWRTSATTAWPGTSRTRWAGGIGGLDPAGAGRPREAAYLERCLRAQR
jgi:hypothetical protein